MKTVSEKAKVGAYKKAIDKEILSVVKDLNKSGYKTIYSCAGHNGEKRGYIMFKNNLWKADRPEVESILLRHKLKGIIFPEYRRELVRFKPIGKGCKT